MPTIPAAFGPMTDAYMQSTGQTCDGVVVTVKKSFVERYSKVIAQIPLKIKKPNTVRYWSASDLVLLRDYYDDALTSRDMRLDLLATRLGRSRSAICRKAKSLGLTNIKRRKTLEPKQRVNKYGTAEERNQATSDRQKKWIKENGHPKGALGLKHSQETLKILSQKSKSHWDSMTKDERDDWVLARRKKANEKGSSTFRNRGSWKAGWRVIGGRRIFYRSRWEANYARYLQWLKANGEISEWEHEAFTFWFSGIKRGCVSYLPDFKVTGIDGSVAWHEVKGWMDARSKTVLNRMRIYHPSEKILVISKKEYTELKKKVSSACDGWE